MRALPNIEVVSAKVHKAWMTERIENPIVPYERLSDTEQEFYRALVRDVYAAIREADKDDLRETPQVRIDREEIPSA